MLAASPRRRRRTWPERFVIAVLVLSIFAAGGTAGVLGYLNSKVSKTQRLSLGHALTAEPTSSDQPENYLLVGTDSGAGLNPNDPALRGRGDVGGARSDTIMILRVDPKSTQAQLLSIPRDLWVTIAGTKGKQKINAAIEYGGAPTLIQTIEDTFQIPIHHYIQVDWKGFEGVVAAVGGVPIYFDKPVRDPNTGINVRAPGCVMLDPPTSLAYVRSRHLQVFQNGHWQEDPSSDFGRSTRQQDFIRRVLKRAVDQGVRNPITLNQLVNAGLKSVQIDAGLSVGQILKLGSRFQSFNPDNLKSIELPVTTGWAGAASVVYLLTDPAQPVLDLFRGVRGGTLQPQSVRVQVLNGSGKQDQASLITSALGKAGFATGTPGDASSPGPNTLVRYAPGQVDKAVLVARYLGGATPTLQESTDLGADTDVVVTTADDLVGVLAIPRPPSDITVPTTTTTTTAPGSSTTVSGPTTTTTSLPGVVPHTPPDVKCG